MKTSTLTTVIISILLLMTGCSRSGVVEKVIADNNNVSQYDDKNIEREQIESLVSAGMNAPCSRDVAVWKFIVIPAGKMNRISNLSSLPIGVTGAKAAIVVCGLSGKFGGGDARKLWHQDCAAATQNIVLAARSMGMTPVWLRVAPFKQRISQVVAALDLDPGIIPFSIIMLGYADSITPVKVQQRPQEVLWL